MKLMVGNDAVAYAVKLSKPDVISAVPITPVSPICEKLNQYIADGELGAKFVEADGEQSVINILMGACAAGCRTFTATTGNGLSWMNDPIYSTPPMRMPVVMAIGHRSLGILNFWADYTDAMSIRDSGWIQLYVANNQEALDTVIQAYKIAEDKRVLLPAMMCFDGWYLSYLSEPVDLPKQEDVDGFLPPFEPEHLTFDPEKLYWYGASELSTQLAMELRCQLQEAMESAKGVIADVGREFGEAFGRGYGLLEGYRSEDAELILVTMGSMSETAKDVVDHARERGLPVGIVRVRSFRPFPGEEIIEATENAGTLVTLDRCVSTGGNGPLYDEVTSALYNLDDRPMVIGAYAGVGGRDVTEERLRDLIDHAWKTHRSGRAPEGAVWVGFYGGRENVVI